MVMCQYLILVSSIYCLAFLKVIDDFTDPAQSHPMGMSYFSGMCLNVSVLVVHTQKLTQITHHKILPFHIS